MAVRKAIGASFWDLARQCLIEGLCLAALGGLWSGRSLGCLKLILAFNQGSIPRAAEITMDWRVLLFTLAASLLTGVLFGLAPFAQFAGDAQTLSKARPAATPRRWKPIGFAAPWSSASLRSPSSYWSAQD